MKRDELVAQIPLDIRKKDIAKSGILIGLCFLAMALGGIMALLVSTS
jgi:hypothetical protein